MGYRIVDQTPKGNALSAYGTSRGIRWVIPLLALVAGSLVLAIGFVLILFSRIPLPQQTLFLIRAPSSFFHDQSSSLPVAWSRAASSVGIPAFFGIALNHNRQPQPFAIVFRGPFRQQGPGLSYTPHGIYTLISETRDKDDVTGQHLPIEPVRLKSLPLSPHGDASFFVRGDLLEAWALHIPLEPNPASLVSGIWDQGVGELHIPAEPSEAQAVDGQLFSVVSDSEQVRRPLATGLLSQGVDVRNITSLPIASSLSVSPLGNRMLTLTWANSLSANDNLLLASAVDDTGTGHRFTFFDMVTSTQDTFLNTDTSHCPGIPRFVLEGEPLQKTLEFIASRLDWRIHLQRVSINAHGTKTLLCVRP